MVFVPSTGVRTRYKIIATLLDSKDLYFLLNFVSVTTLDARLFVGMLR